jgi:hypothetical protein
LLRQGEAKKLKWDIDFTDIAIKGSVSGNVPNIHQEN